MPYLRPGQSVQYVSPLAGFTYNTNRIGLTFVDASKARPLTKDETVCFSVFNNFSPDPLCSCSSSPCICDVGGARFVALLNLVVSDGIHSILPNGSAVVNVQANVGQALLVFPRNADPRTTCGAAFRAFSNDVLYERIKEEVLHVGGNHVRSLLDDSLLPVPREDLEFVLRGFHDSFESGWRDPSFPLTVEFEGGVDSHVERLPERRDGVYLARGRGAFPVSGDSLGDVPFILLPRLLPFERLGRDVAPELVFLLHSLVLRGGAAVRSLPEGFTLVVVPHRVSHHLHLFLPERNFFSCTLRRGEGDEMDNAYSSLSVAEKFVTFTSPSSLRREVYFTATPFFVSSPLPPTPRPKKRSSRKKKKARPKKEKEQRKAAEEVEEVEEKSEDDEIECPVCTEEVEEMVPLPCEGRHRLCSVCLLSWKMKCLMNGGEVTCPLCREVVEGRV